MKICNICKEEKNEDEFYHTKYKTGIEYILPYCKECNKKKNKKWRDNNIEQARASYRSSTDTKEKRTERNLRYRNEGKFSLWQKNNPEKIKGYQAKRAHKNHTITDAEWEFCKNYFDNKCAYCGMALEDHIKKYGQGFHKDHFDSNGKNDLSNCIPSCRICNSSKWEFKFEDWYTDNNSVYCQQRFLKIMKWIQEDYKNILL